MSYGTVHLDPAANKWIIDTAPHVRVRLRRFFESAKNDHGNLIRLDATAGNARDLEWFLERYEHTVAPQHLRILRLTAAGHKQTEENTRAIMDGTITLPPIKLHTPLRDYQNVAFDLFRVRKSIMCADDLGLGKTAVGVAAAIYAPPSLVLCQTHLQEQWRKEIKKFAPNARVRIAPTGRPTDVGDYDILIMPYTKVAGWRDTLAGKIKTVVMDEMQEFRHEGTAKYVAGAHIAEGAENRLGLTATPIYNYGGEIFNTMDMLRPGELGTREEFQREWCSFGGKGKWIVNDPIALRAHLLDNGMMIRRTRADVKRELPPLQKIQHRCPFNQRLMDDLEGDALQLARAVVSTSSSFNEKGIAAREFDNKLRQITGIAKAPSVAELVTDFASKGDKIVLAAWHLEVYAIYAHKFKEEGIPVWFYTGSETPKQKDANVEAFIKHQGGAVFCMSLRSGAGLNGLQNVCSTVVYGELDWSPKVHDQLTGRLVRDGQTQSVEAIYCTIDAGSDPTIASVLGLKDEQSAGLIDGKEIEDKDMLGEPEAPISRVAMMAQEFIKRTNSSK